MPSILPYLLYSFARLLLPYFLPLCSLSHPCLQKLEIPIVKKYTIHYHFVVLRLEIIGEAVVIILTAIVALICNLESGKITDTMSVDVVMAIILFCYACGIIFITGVWPLLRSRQDGAKEQDGLFFRYFFSHHSSVCFGILAAK